MSICWDSSTTSWDWMWNSCSGSLTCLSKFLLRKCLKCQLLHGRDWNMSKLLCSLQYSIFFAMSSKFFVTIMMVHQKVKVFVLNPLQGWPPGGRKGPFSAQKPNGIISPPYPEVTLDNFSFPTGGRLAAWRAVFWPPGRILVFFGSGLIAYISTLILVWDERILVGSSGSPKNYPKWGRSRFG